MRFSGLILIACLLVLAAAPLHPADAAAPDASASKSELRKKFLDCYENKTLEEFKVLWKQHPEIAQDIQSGRFPLLHQAVKDQKYEFIEFFCVNEADPNVCTNMAGSVIPKSANITAIMKIKHSIQSVKYSLQVEPLSIAALNEDHRIIDLLLRFGADINGNRTGEYWAPPFRYSLSYGQLNTLTYMLNRGADINRRDSNGNTILHILAAGWNTSNYERAIELGADPWIKDNFGSYPMHYTEPAINSTIRDEEFAMMETVYRTALQIPNRISIALFGILELLFLTWLVRQFLFRRKRLLEKQKSENLIQTTTAGWDLQPAVDDKQLQKLARSGAILRVARPLTVLPVLLLGYILFTLAWDMAIDPLYPYARIWVASALIISGLASLTVLFSSNRGLALMAHSGLFVSLGAISIYALSVAWDLYEIVKLHTAFSEARYLWLIMAILLIQFAVFHGLLVRHAAVLAINHWRQIRFRNQFEQTNLETSAQWDSVKAGEE